MGILMNRLYIIVAVCGVGLAAGPARGQTGDISGLFTFQIAGAPGQVAPHKVFDVKVGLKRDFTGTAKFYSCDKDKFRLLDVQNAEFVENISYKIEAKTGPIGKFQAGFFGEEDGTAPLVCGEFSWAPKGTEKRFYAQQTNMQIFRPDRAEDWYDTNILQAILLDDAFAKARTKKLLTNYYSPEAAKALLPELVKLIAEERDYYASGDAIKLIASKYGGKEPARELAGILKPAASRRPKVVALDLLSYCGADGREVAIPAVNELLIGEKDEIVVSDALLLMRNWGVEPPPRFQKRDDISSGASAEHRKEIQMVCDRAAGVDLSFEGESPSLYDDNGVHIPTPTAAKTAIDSLETLIGKMPNYPEMARAYLLLGRLKERFDTAYHEGYNAETQERSVPPEVSGKMEQYWNHESAATYYYNGYHFDRLLALFPNSEYADDAAYEKIASEPGGDCEGDENCQLEYGVEPYFGFLKKSPSSDLAGKAIAVINKEFEYLLGGKSDRISGSEDLSIGSLKRTIGEYEAATSSVAPAEKAKAEDVICSLWEKTGEKDKAVAACERILKGYPGYAAAADIKKRVEKMKAEGFELKPAAAIGYMMTLLEWAEVADSNRYLVYRSSDDGKSFIRLAQVSEGNSYRDKSVSPGIGYTYYVDAERGGGAISSNRVMVSVPGERQGSNFVFYSSSDNALCVFGYVSNAQHEGLPYVTRIYDDGKVVRSVTGAFYGYFKSELDKYADGTIYVDPIHQKYIHLPGGPVLANSLRTVTTQDMSINPYPEGKWWARPGEYSISISEDNSAVWLTGISGRTWPMHDFLVWDSSQGVAWEARGRLLIRYDSPTESRGIPYATNEKIYFDAVYPDAHNGGIWAVGTSGSFYRLAKSGEKLNQFDKERIASHTQVAFYPQENYAWLMNVDYNDPSKTKLSKISLADGKVIISIKPEEYTEPGEAHGNFSMHISLDRATGNLWVFNGGHGNGKATKLSPQGKRLNTMKL